jgi:hypothetical protein
MATPFPSSPQHTMFPDALCFAVAASHLIWNEWRSKGPVVTLCSAAWPKLAPNLFLSSPVQQCQLRLLACSRFDGGCSASLPLPLRPLHPCFLLCPGPWNPWSDVDRGRRGIVGAVLWWYYIAL